MIDKFYTVEQIAELLHIHHKTIQRYIREGKLHAVKVGKSWRVSGHDLSVFTENTGGSAVKKRNELQGTITRASAVVDIQVADSDSAIRIMNSITAALNAKPPEMGHSSMNTQFIEAEKTVRITLWGSVEFIAVMMEGIRLLTKPQNEE